VANRKIDSTLVGPAGEHLVLSRLLAQGLLASPAPRGTRKVDIIVNYIDGGNPKLVQVKTTMGSSRKGWVLQAKHEDIVSEDLFYCFVSFENVQGEVFVVPSGVVAEAVKVSHAQWLSTPGKKGQAHNDNSMRNISLTMFGQDEGWLDQYKENWAQLA
jgi:hypothetical protein